MDNSTKKATSAEAEATFLKFRISVGYFAYWILMGRARACTPSFSINARSEQ